MEVHNLMLRRILKRDRYLFNKPWSVRIGDILSTNRILAIILTALLWSVFITMIFILLALCITFVIQIIFDINSLQNPVNNAIINVVSGLVGAAIGAVTGGIISFRIQSKELQSGAAIERRDNVYRPIRDEVLSLQLSLSRIPYPGHISTTEASYSGNDAKFALWTKIRSSSKAIDIPVWIRDGIDRYISTIQDYNNSILETYKEIPRKADQILEEKYPGKYPINEKQRIKELRITRLLIARDLTEATLLAQFDAPIQAIISPDLEQLQVVIYEQCSALPSMNKVNTLYEQLNRYSVELIDELERRIKYINYTYEGQNDRF
jgi:hypothetical protein